MWYFYFARCSDGSLYSGITNNIKRRERLHNDGKASQYTKYRRPVKIIYSEVYQNKSEARVREIQIKKWSRIKKENLLKINNYAADRN